MMLNANIEREANDHQHFNFYLMRRGKREKRITLNELKLLTIILYQNKEVITELTPGSQISFEVVA